MNKIEYKKSIKKQVATGLGCFIVICILGWEFFPVNTLEKITFFSIGILLITIFTFWAIKKFCQSASCPSCESDLFEVINAANPNQLSFNYCPNCGARVEI